MICLAVDDDADTRNTIATNLYSALDILKDSEEQAGMMLLDYNLPESLDKLVVEISKIHASKNDAASA